VIEQTKRDAWEIIKWAGFASIIGVFGVLLLYSSFEYTDTLSSFDTAFYRVFFVVFSCISIMMARAALTSYREHVGNRIHIDIDRARLMRGERVLTEIDFSTNPRVEASYKRLKRIGSDPEVQALCFSSGLNSVCVEDGSGLTQELLVEMLPLLKAASRKHSMRLGDNITELLGKHTGD
jgi:hypothetical protein